MNGEVWGEMYILGITEYSGYFDIYPEDVLILILDQPIDKLSAIISSFCVKPPCQACSPPVGGGVGIMPTEGLTDRPACLRSFSKVNGVT